MLETVLLNGGAVQLFLKEYSVHIMSFETLKGPKHFAVYLKHLYTDFPPNTITCVVQSYVFLFRCKPQTTELCIGLLPLIHQQINCSDRYDLLVTLVLSKQSMCPD